MDIIEEIKEKINTYVDEERAAVSPRYFQAFEGGYGEGDQFIGVAVPNLRKVARSYYRHIEITDVERLLKEPIHEYRFTALCILVYKFEKAKDRGEKETIVNTYLRNLESVNNWDLVDCSADKILGAFVFDKDKSILYDLARSLDLWKQRIAIISTFYFIRQNHFHDTIEIAKILLNHKHDLIHKAVGWMLREIGNRDFDVEFHFLKDNYKRMPRTMLRYAIEKFDPDLRQQFLKGLI